MKVVPFWQNVANCEQLLPGTSAVPVYRFYKLDKIGRIMGLGEAVECADDADAVKKAKERAKGHTIIEVWDMGRRVAVIEATGKK